jgi:DNA-binding response OmpR family regulator
MPESFVATSEEDEIDSPAVRTDATVLVVEDHDDMRAYLRDLLVPHYHVEEAADGEAGLAAARRLAAEDRAPDLVISDLMMPGLDGYALCHALKEDEALGHVPVVLLTARADEESKLEGLSEGADDYLAKPFSAEELLARCENLIEVRRRLRARFSGEVVVRPSDRVVESSEVVVEREEADWVEAARAVCEEHIADANFGVDWLADELDVSTRTLRRRLKAASGLTPGAFLRTLRLERAAELLEAGADGVAEVGAAVGYTNADWFSQAFRQGFGVPPSAWAEGERP